MVGVDRRIVKLKATQEMMEKYNPPPGISLIFLEWIPQKEEVIVEFTASPLQPDPIYRKNMNDIRHELGLVWRDRLLQDNLGGHPNSPKRALVIETILNHPLITGQTKGLEHIKSLLPAGTPLVSKEIQKAAEEAQDVHEIRYTPEQAAEQLRLSSTGQKLDIEPDDVRQDHYKEQILTRGGEKVEYVDRYGKEYNVYLSGVIASG
jgi:hypothetical protein